MSIDYIVAKEDYDEYMEIIEKQKQEIERLNNIIKEVREYIEKVETLALVDKKIIFSMSTLKAILDKGDEIVSTL